jgi:hypothetical protein
VFVIAKVRGEQYFAPRLIRVRGISEGTWERKRPVWEGDRDRDRVPPRKKMKTKHDENGNGEATQEGNTNGGVVDEECMVEGE